MKNNIKCILALILMIVVFFFVAWAYTQPVPTGKEITVTLIAKDPVIYSRGEHYFIKVSTDEGRTEKFPVNGEFYYKHEVGDKLDAIEYDTLFNKIRLR